MTDPYNGRYCMTVTVEQKHAGENISLVSVFPSVSGAFERDGMLFVMDGKEVAGCFRLSTILIATRQPEGKLYEANE